MRTCTVFVLPSRYEGLGCVYLEAMASGKPVIACRGQGIDEVIDHGRNGWLIPIDGLEELVQGLQALLGDAELRARIGRAARQTILDKLTLSHQAQSLMRIYEEAAR
jgi:glycosyltransferase involved in cell wall biosynthesis